MRKEAGFEVTDRIRVYYEAEGNAAKVLENHKAAIAKIVLADSVECGKADGYSKDWDIVGDRASLTVVKA